MFGLACHVGEWDAIPAFVDAVHERFGRIDALVNNAGINPARITPGGHDPRLLAQSVLCERRGPLANEPVRLPDHEGAGRRQHREHRHDGGVLRWRQLCAYGASKGALLNLTKSMASEWAQWKIRVNILSPGPFMSEMMEGGERTAPGFLELVAGGTFMKRIADPARDRGPRLLSRERRLVVRDRRRHLGVRRDDEVNDPVGHRRRRALRTGADWLDEFPALKTELPELLPDTDPRFGMDTGEMFAYFVSDDLLRNVPHEQRMPIEQLVTPVMPAHVRPGTPGGSATPDPISSSSMTDPEARVAWMDEVGIAFQHLISGAGYTLARAIDDVDLSRRAPRAVNTWMTDAASAPPRSASARDFVAVRRPRLGRGGDLRAHAERGSRAFLVSAEPAGGIPPITPTSTRSGPRRPTSA